MAARFEQFELVEQIGGGGSGCRVYRAVEHLADGVRRDVAIKRLPHILPGDTAGKQRFMQEAQAIVHLSQDGHPNIVQCFGCGITNDGEPWISMQFLSDNLRRRMNDDPAPSVEVERMLRQVLSGLERMEQMTPPLLHNDLKPSNLLVDASGNYRIIDFGLAAELNANETQDMATARYCAPEVLNGKLGARGPWSDIYSLGFMALEFALGRKKFAESFEWAEEKSNTLATTSRRWIDWHSDERYPAPRIDTMLPSFPADLAAVIQRMLCKPIAERLQNPGQVLQAMNGATPAPQPTQTASTTTPTTPTTPPPPQRHVTPTVGANKKQTQMILLCAVVGTMLIAIVIAIFKPISSVVPVIKINAPNGPITTRVASAELLGEVVDFPEEGKLQFRTKTNAAPVRVDPNGQFAHKIPMPALGDIEGELIITDDEQQPVVRYPLKIRREPPVTVDVTFRTSPPTPDVNLNLTKEGAPDIALVTDSAGQVKHAVPYGTFAMKVDHAKFQVVGGKAPSVETSIDPAKQVDLRMELKALPVQFRVIPQTAKVELFDEAGKALNPAVKLKVNPLGEATLEMAPGKYQYKVKQDPHEPAEGSFTVTRGQTNEVELIANGPPPPPTGGTGAGTLGALGGVIGGGLPQQQGDGWAALDTVAVAGMTDDAFVDLLKASAPLDTLRIVKPPAGMKVIRIEGEVLNTKDLEVLQTRLKPAGGRVRLEVRVEPDSVAAQLTQRLRKAGVNAVTAQKRGERRDSGAGAGDSGAGANPAADTIPWRLLVSFGKTQGFDREKIEQICLRYTFARSNVEVRGPF